MSPPNPVWIHNLIFYRRYPVHYNHLGYPSNGYVNHINRKLEQLGERVMARKNSSSGDNASSWQVTFVQLKLDQEQAEKFSVWMERKEPEIALDVAAFMSNGHKTSITWDDENKCWIVSATCKDDKSDNYNFCLSSRSSEWWEAMCMNVFKHDVVCKAGKWSDKQQNSNWG